MIKCWALLALLVASPAHGDVFELSYRAKVAFDPAGDAGGGGTNAGALVEALFGADIAATGSFDVTGAVWWDGAAPAVNANSYGAGFPEAPIAAEVQWAGQTARADLDQIRAHAQSSNIGYNTRDFGGACATRTLCRALGQPFTPTGRILQVVDNNDFVLERDGRQVRYGGRDLVAFAIGGTESRGDFSGALNTEAFGRVAIDSLGLGFISNASASLLQGVEMPRAPERLTSRAVEIAVLTLSIDTEHHGKVRFKGVVTGFEMRKAKY